MKKTTFKFTVFGLFLAVFLCFAFLSNNFIGVYANESTDEILEEEITERIYVYEEEEGISTLILKSDNTYSITYDFYDEQSSDVILQGSYKQQVENEVVLFFGDEPLEIILYDNGKFDYIEDEIVEDETIEDEVVEDNETEPSEDLGFLEQHWKTIVASLLGTFGGVGGLLLFVLKFLKASKNILTDVGKQNTDNKTVKDKIEKVVEKLTLAEENLNKIIQKTEEYEKKLETNANSLFENYGEELKTLEKDFLKFADVMKIVVNNNSELVKKGIAEKVNKIIDEKE